MRISDWSSDVCSSDLGTLLTIPAAKQLGRKPMFAIYFAVATFSIFITFGAPLPPQMRLYSYFLIGLSVFGVFGSFTYYLPELFPTRLRATGAGFCSNIGRVLAAVGPFMVCLLARSAERRVGQECVSAFRSRWAPSH